MHCLAMHNCNIYIVGKSLISFPLAVLMALQCHEICLLCLQWWHVWLSINPSWWSWFGPLCPPGPFPSLLMPLLYRAISVPGPPFCHSSNALLTSVVFNSFFDEISDVAMLGYSLSKLSIRISVMSWSESDTLLALSFLARSVMPFT